MITFDKLLETLAKRNKTTYTLLRDRVIGDGTLARIKHGQSVSTDTIDKLCDYLNCRVQDIITFTKDNT